MQNLTKISNNFEEALCKMSEVFVGDFSPKLGRFKNLTNLIS